MTTAQTRSPDGLMDYDEAIETLRPGAGSGGARRTRHRHQDVLRLPDRLRCRAEHPGLPDLPGVPRRDAGGQPHRRRVRDPDRPGAELRRSRPGAGSPGRTTSTRTCRRTSRPRSTTSRSPPTATWTSRSTGETVRVEIERAHMEEDTGKSTHVGGATGRISRSRVLAAGLQPGRRAAGRDRHQADRRHQGARAAGGPRVRHGAPRSAVLAGCLGRQDGSGLAALRRERLAHPGREPGVRHPHRDQERQLAALGGTGGALRDHPAGSASRHRRPDRQETRHFDESTGTTSPGRSKETAEDYRYFPEPDLVPLAPEREWVESIRASLPELPWIRRDRHAGRLGADRPADARPAGRRRRRTGRRDRGRPGPRRRRPRHGGRPTSGSRRTPAVSR